MRNTFCFSLTMVNRQSKMICLSGLKICNKTIYICLCVCVCVRAHLIFSFSIWIGKCLGKTVSVASDWVLKNQTYVEIQFSPKSSLPVFILCITEWWCNKAQTVREMIKMESLCCAHWWFNTYCLSTKKGLMVLHEYVSQDRESVGLSSVWCI